MTEAASDTIREAQARVLREARSPRRPRARGRIARRHGKQNQTERAYGRHLEIRKAAGELLWYAYEPIRLRLAERCYYTPDYLVMRPDGEIEIHEIKGHMEDDAAVKLRVVAEQYWMFRLMIVRRRRGHWEFEERTR
jgi:hypothetical protein